MAPGWVFWLFMTQTHELFMETPWSQILYKWGQLPLNTEKVSEHQSPAVPRSSEFGSWASPQLTEDSSSPLVTKEATFLPPGS